MPREESLIEKVTTVPSDTLFPELSRTAAVMVEAPCMARVSGVAVNVIEAGPDAGGAPPLLFPAAEEEEVSISPHDWENKNTMFNIKKDKKSFLFLLIIRVPPNVV